MIRALVSLGLMLLAAPACAGELFEQPRSAAQAQAVLRAAMPDAGQVQLLRGRFSQRKFLREIPRPLVSSGEFVLLRERGIWWHTQTPLDSELRLRSGDPLQPRGRQPGLELAASVFFALFTLDLATLTRSFELFMIEPTAPGMPWQLGLRPRDAVVATWFARATLSGRARLERVTLFEAAGDRTEIDLDAAAQPLSSLTAAERQRFED